MDNKSSFQGSGGLSKERSQAPGNSKSNSFAKREDKKGSPNRKEK